LGDATLGVISREGGDMHVSIDRTSCTGHGRCFTLAPEVFGYDDEGFSILKAETVGPELEAAARRGAGGCPERAIGIEDA
jgi:ferredoxin